MKNRNKALNMVRMYRFAVIEANMFLDTHPHDKQALEYFQKVSAMYKKAKAEYTEKYGPLSVVDASEQNGKFYWVKGPWPWEVEANVEL